MLFPSWQGLGRVALVGAMGYVALVALLRISGNRTLSKLNAFDLVVTVALGSALATLLLNKDVPLAEGVLGWALLVGLQYVVTWTSVRVPAFGRLVTAEPLLLVHHGRLLHAAMRRGRVARDEVLAVLREHGVSDVADVRAVVLESDGSLSVLQEGGAEPETLRNVRGPRSES